MPRYEVVTTVTERFRIVVDAPSAEVAQAIVTRALVEREYNLYELVGHEIGDTGVTIDVTEREGATDPDLAFNPEAHGDAEALLAEYGGR